MRRRNVDRSLGVDKALEGGGLRRARHVPLRTCAGCGERAPRATLRRITVAPGGTALQWRTSGGRGTYLHEVLECRRRFVVGKKRLPGLRVAVGRVARQALIEALPEAG